MEKRISVKNIYLLLVISLGLIGLGIGSTYAVFTTSAEISDPITLSSNLSYGSDIIETVEVEVAPGATVSTTLNVSNSTNSALNYAAWYIDNGKDYEVVCEKGIPQGTVSSGGSTSMIVNTRNYSDETITVSVGVSSNNNNVTLGSNMKQVEDVNFLMNVLTTPSASTNLFSSSLTRGQISSITFVDNINVPSGYTSVDVSKNSDGTVLMWYGSANSSGYYDVYIGSSSGITSIDSGKNLFADLGNCTAINFNGYVDTSHVITMNYMFYGGSSIQTLDLDDWDVSNVVKMNQLFFNCSSLNEINVSAWDTGNVSDMSGLFYLCTGLSKLDLSNWDTSNVKNMVYMFYSTESNPMTLTSIGDVSNWNTGNVTDMSFMFSLCKYLEELDVSNWDTSSVTNMQYMFQGCISIKYLDLSNWDVSNVTSMVGMFLSTNTIGEMALISIGDVGNWDTGKVTNMTGMFQWCANLQSLNVSNWDVSNVTKMSYLFNDCMSIEELDVSKWDVSNVTEMTSIFKDTNVKVLDLSNWNTSKVTSMYYAFYNCTSLEKIYASSNYVISSGTNTTSMFYNCTSLVGGAGTVYNSSYVDGTYARIDGGTINPGYFSWVGLPSGYTRLEYIESSGTQYIDLNLPIEAENITKLQYKMDAAFLNSANALYIHGNTYIGYYSSSLIAYYARGGVVSSNSSLTYNSDRHTFILDCVNGYGSIDSVQTSLTGTPSKPIGQFILFGWQPANLNQSRLWSCQVWYDGQLVRDMVPCKNSDGVVGLYCMVTGQFYSNSGTGSFTAGPSV